jgi:hypothetical protein
MKYARLVNNTAVEIITLPDGFNIQDCYHPDLIKDIVSVEDDVQVNWVRQEDGTFVAPVESPIEIVVEDAVEALIESPAE